MNVKLVRLEIENNPTDKSSRMKKNGRRISEFSSTKVPPIFPFLSIAMFANVQDTSSSFFAIQLSQKVTHVFTRASSSHHLTRKEVRGYILQACDWSISINATFLLAQNNLEQSFSPVNVICPWFEVLILSRTKSLVANLIAFSGAT